MHTLTPESVNEYLSCLAGSPILGNFSFEAPSSPNCCGVVLHFKDESGALIASSLVPGIFVSILSELAAAALGSIDGREPSFNGSLCVGAACGHAASDLIALRPDNDALTYIVCRDVASGCAMSFRASKFKLIQLSQLVVDVSHLQQWSDYLNSQLETAPPSRRSRSSRTSRRSHRLN